MCVLLVGGIISSFLFLFRQEKKQEKKQKKKKSERFKWVFSMSYFIPAFRT